MARRPTFLFIGPDKTGSTWLHAILRRHPECFVPPGKDLYFFDRYYGRGLDWYLAHFAEAPDEARAVGELSHDYLFSPEAARRIARDLPDARLVTSLRNPVDRTFSHYLYLVRNDLCRSPFAAALDEHPELIRNSLYATHLEAFLAHGPASRIHVALFDELESAPEEFARKIFTFLGISWVPDLGYREKVLPASRPRSRLAAHVAHRAARIVRDAGFGRLVGRVKYGPVGRMLYRPYGRDERPVIPDDARQRLDDLFAPEIARLEETFGLDLSSWRAGTPTGAAR